MMQGMFYVMSWADGSEGVHRRSHRGSLMEDRDREIY